MTPGIRKIKMIAMLAITLAVTTVFLASPPSEVLGITSEIKRGGVPPPIYDYSLLPQGVTADAFRVASELYGENTKKKREFTGELLAIYLAAKDKDLIILFNPGGWGWRFLDDSPNWPGIFTGIQEDTRDAGYKSLFLEYRRSVKTLKSYIDEYMAIIGLYPVKARALASRVEFLTDHIPNLKIILTGESNGTIICDQALEILRDNLRIYSIQMGTPFWRKHIRNERILVINDNGIQPDAFSNGDFFTLLSRNLEISLGLSPPQPSVGTVLNILVAPGHAYSWENPVVRKQIENFLNKNFPAKQFNDF